jgi:crotonobetainyl-CoA:carnitine CoA-transferase CaiB-like acyl-CoA transferase
MMLGCWGVFLHMCVLWLVPGLGGAVSRGFWGGVGGPFPTADGHLSAVVYSDRDWARFFAMIGRPELADDARYATLNHRTERLEELYELVAEHLARDTTAVWFARFTEAGIPAVPYNRVDDLFDDPHFRAVGLLEEVEHPTEGRLLRCATPVTFDGVRTVSAQPAPELGADTDAVLQGLRKPSPL